MSRGSDVAIFRIRLLYCYYGNEVRRSFLALRLEVGHCTIEVSHRLLFTKDWVHPRKILAGFVVDSG
jgi:hypothetical protein